MKLEDFEKAKNIVSKIKSNNRQLEILSRFIDNSDTTPLPKLIISDENLIDCSDVRVAVNMAILLSHHKRVIAKKLEAQLSNIDE